MSLAAIVALSLMSQPQAEPNMASVSFMGKIREVANKGTSVAMLEIDDSRALPLVGGDKDLSAELRRLAGVRVKITGVRSSKDAPDGEPITVTAYEILDVGGGVVPRVGTIAAITVDGKKRLIFVDATGTAELLSPGWVKRMSQHVGSKVWMVGRRSKGIFRPQRFSILRPFKSVHEDSEKKE